MSRKHPAESTTATERWAEPVYLDASALVKLFVPEAASDELNRALAGLTDVIVSHLALTEMASALGRRTREQRLTPEEAQRLYREALKLHASSLSAELTPPIHRRAERLMLALAIPLRALDALHLASALAAEAATVVTFNPRLREACASQSLFIIAPAIDSPARTLPPLGGMFTDARRGAQDPQRQTYECTREHVRSRVATTAVEDDWSSSGNSHRRFAPDVRPDAPASGRTAKHRHESTAGLRPGRPADDLLHRSDILVVDPAFGGLVQVNSFHQAAVDGCAVGRGSGVWNGLGRYLVWSDIPNNVQLRWLEDDGHVTVFRNPSNNSNGNTFDFQGRQLSSSLSPGASCATSTMDRSRSSPTVSKASA